MCRYKMGNPKKQSQFICLKHLGINHLGDGIQRNKQREKGHVKDLHCPVCKETVKCLEVRYCDWLEEMMNKAKDLHLEYYGKVGC